ILTQNMNNPMGLIDTWTITHAVIMLVQIICLRLIFKREEREKSEEVQETKDFNIDTGSQIRV
ncbi:MAG: hypothetical protein FWC67_02920, partial [Defluviitaleaceae bacterium]|nr:hypothetical protein [Defluviitaleaceae bacterium]